MRKFVIGDIHGGLKALKQVLERAGVTPNDHLVFLGDYVDGWSEAVETIDFLMALDTAYQCTFLRGNHDELCYDWLAHNKDNPTWFVHGGKATVASYERVDDKTKEAHIHFYKTLENYHLDKENRIFLHAGFTHLKGIAHEYFVKNFYWDRTLWEMALSLNPKLSKDHTNYPSRLQQYSEIYIGHTPVTRIGKTTPQNAANVWNIDTGAAFKGPLSIMDVNSKEIWQSDPVYLLYPDEDGRN